VAEDRNKLDQPHPRRDEIVRLYQTGLVQSKVAAELGIPWTTVSEVIKQERIRRTT
jgi:DNA-binding transcriptional regulator LsrR (DeoR family)